MRSRHRDFWGHRVALGHWGALGELGELGAGLGGCNDFLAWTEARRLHCRPPLNNTYITQLFRVMADMDMGSRSGFFPSFPSGQSPVSSHRYRAEVRRGREQGGFWVWCWCQCFGCVMTPVPFSPPGTPSHRLVQNPCPNGDHDATLSTGMQWVGGRWSRLLSSRRPSDMRGVTGWRYWQPAWPPPPEAMPLFSPRLVSTTAAAAA